MLLNGSPLNAVPLNGGASSNSEPPAVAVEPVVSVLWDVRLMLGGLDVSANLAGQVRIEREEGAATLADFVLSLDAGPVNPASFIGQSVSIYYRHWSGSAWTETLRFVGQVIRPQYSMQERLISCDCSDRLQDAIEAMTVSQVDSLTGGVWSTDVFETPEGRSRWDYAQERMSTRPASLQKNTDGTLQVTNWAAGAPAYVFPPGSVLDQSMDWIPVELNERVNVLELELDYRFSRLRQRHQAFSWGHPAGNFCDWRTDTSELPTVDMITEASNGAGYQAILAAASWVELPPSGTYCTPAAIWINTVESFRLLLSGNWTSARRWVQPVTEQYKLRVEAPASIAQAGEVIRRDRIVAESESDRAQEFEAAVFDAPDPDATQDALGDWVVDVRESGRLSSAIEVGVSMARVQVLAAHRGNRLVFQLPTADVLGVHLDHTLRVEDTIFGRSISCQAKLFSLIDEWDFESGAALTSLSLAVSQGGGVVDDPVSPPPLPPTTPPGVVPETIVLPTQLGGMVGEPPFDDLLDGFSGNYDNYNTIGIERHPRRMRVTAPEIPATHQDEFKAEQAATYRVVIPDDLLEL